MLSGTLSSEVLMEVFINGFFTVLTSKLFLTFWGLAATSSAVCFVLSLFHKGGRHD